MSNLEKVLNQNPKKEELLGEYNGQIGEDSILLRCTQESLLIEISNKRKIFVLRAILNPDQISELSKENLTTPERLFKNLKAALTSKAAFTSVVRDESATGPMLIHRRAISIGPM